MSTHGKNDSKKVMCTHTLDGVEMECPVPERSCTECPIWALYMARKYNIDVYIKQMNVGEKNAKNKIAKE